MTNQYPTPDEIQEFLKAHEEGGEAAIANLLREKQKARLETPPKKSKRRMGPVDLERLRAPEPGTMKGPIGYEVAPKEK